MGRGMRRFFVHSAHDAAKRPYHCSARARTDAANVDESVLPLRSTVTKRVGIVSADPDTIELPVCFGGVEWLPRWTDHEVDCVLIDGWNIDADDLVLKAVEAHCERGGAIVATRTRGPVFNIWPDFDRDVLGVVFERAAPSRESRMLVRPLRATQERAIVDDIGTFRTTAPEFRAEAADGSVVPVMLGVRGHRADPVAWTRRHNGGRVFHTSLAADDEDAREMVMRLSRNALAWALQLET